MTLYCIGHREHNAKFEQEKHVLGNFPLKEVRRTSDDEQSDKMACSDTSDEEGGNSKINPRHYHQTEFITMWETCETFIGEMTDEIEATRRVRAANSKMSAEDTDGQLKAQYGRLLPRAMKVCCALCFCIVSPASCSGSNYIFFFLFVRR